MPRATGWAAESESGSAGALRILWQIYRFLGRSLVLRLRWPVVLYFFLRSAARRSASRQYLQHVHAAPSGRAALPTVPGTREVLRHFSEFGINLVDRMIVWAGGVDEVQVDYDGDEHLRPLVRDGKGAILLGAHLGSFDMLRALAKKYDFVVNVLMFTRHAPNINAFFGALDPSSRMRVIPVDPDSVRAAFEIRTCIRKGELVAILADRADAGNRGQARETSFLGEHTTFPFTPHLVASTLDCPLLLALCVRTPDDRYRAIVRPLRETLAPRAGSTSREERIKDASKALERYVQYLEHFCYRFPYQWGNFYDFWTHEPTPLSGREPSNR